MAIVAPMLASRHRSHKPSTGAARPAAGYTLIELLVVMSIAAVLAGSATPAMIGFIKSVRLTSATNDLFASLLMARSEAIKRRARVALCKSSGGSTCASAGGWEQGWIVFQDMNNSGTRQPGEEILLNAPAMPGGLRLGGNLNVERYVSYSSTGAAKLVGGAFQAGTITLCNESAASSEGRQIILSSSGRPRVAKTRLDSCP